MSLPKSKDKLGYTTEEIRDICKKRNISNKSFNDTFGVNTCAMGKDGHPRYYLCDVERALYILGNKDGNFHEWD